MTPKLKAEELINKYLDANYSDLSIYGALSCALIAVDEILNYLEVYGFSTQIEYWQEVKQEIEKL
jgi:hypothetical protein